jgi:hypothetical protein
MVSHIEHIAKVVTGDRDTGETMMADKPIERAR